MPWCEHDKELSVLILSGSPIIGSFDFRARVDFVRVPGVIKLRNGDYTSLNLHIDIDQTLADAAARSSITPRTSSIPTSSSSTRSRWACAARSRTRSGC